IAVHYGGVTPLKSNNMFSNDPSTLRELGIAFDHSIEEARVRGNVVTSAYVNLSNPLYITDADAIPTFASPDAAKRYKRKLLAKGHDGIVVDMRQLDGDIQYIVFSGNQVMPVKGKVKAGKMDVATEQSPEFKETIRTIKQVPDNILEKYTPTTSYTYSEQAKLQELRDV